MKTITIDDKVVEKRVFKRYLERFMRKQGYEKTAKELPFDILSEHLPGALMCFAALKLTIGEEFNLDMAGLMFKCRKLGNYSLEFDKDALCSSLGIEKEDPELLSLLSSGIKQRVKKGTFWSHPLSEVTDVDGEEFINNYATASLLIHYLRHPSSTDDNGASVELNVRRLMLASGQNLPVDALIERVKAGYIISLHRAANAIAEGFSAMIKEA
jgi:hypothetical protein